MIGLDTYLFLKIQLDRQFIRACIDGEAEGPAHINNGGMPKLWMRPTVILSSPEPMKAHNLERECFCLSIASATILR